MEQKWIKVGFEVINLSNVTKIGIIKQSESNWKLIIESGKDYIVFERNSSSEVEIMKMADKFLNCLYSNEIWFEINI